jgi:hypothetical protein
MGQDELREGIAATEVWDVFVSHSHTDEATAATVAAALGESGLRVFRAVGAIGTFTSISDSVLRALRNSRILLACYSADYPTRSACQYEFATAYLSGHGEGDPLRRVMAINLERSLDHIEPRHLRDVLLPTIPSSPTALAAMVDAVSARVGATIGVVGEVAERPPRWLVSRPIHPPNDFVGRWRELWWLHSALHPRVGPLTSPPTSPIVVVHGPGGIGKTALAAEYIRRFGAAFPGGVVWRTSDSPDTATSTRRSLWVLDDAAGTIADVADRLPPDTDATCLVLTRDPRLAKLGNALTLADLTTSDSAQLIAAHGFTHDLDTLDRIATATAGSPELRGRVAYLASTLGADNSLDRLHRSSTDLLAPLAKWLAPELETIGGHGWDVLRVLVAAAPATVSILRIADVLAGVRDSDRVHEIVPVQTAVTELLARGVLPAEPDAVDLELPSALVLALRQLDPDPYRAERIRAASVRALAQGRGAYPAVHPVSRPHHAHFDEELRAAHRIRTELLNRITGHPLAQDEGSLREALTSLHRLLDITRTTKGNIHPAALHPPPPGPNLGEITDRLINDVLRQSLTHWHVELGAHEDLRPPEVSRIDHERDWTGHNELRQALNTINVRALDVADQLGAITEAPQRQM